MGVRNDRLSGKYPGRACRDAFGGCAAMRKRIAIGMVIGGLGFGAFARGEGAMTNIFDLTSS